MNRLEHIKQTYLFNIDIAAQSGLDFEFVNLFAFNFNMNISKTSKRHKYLWDNFHSLDICLY